MRKFFNEFKEFAMRGNVIDMAVGIVIGLAFGKVVTSLVNNIIMPPIGILTGGTDMAYLKWTLKGRDVTAEGQPIPPVTIDYGQFINTIVDFVLVAFAVFLVVKTMNALKRRRAAEAPSEPSAPSPSPSEPEPGPRREEELLTEIRDLLRSRT